MITSEVIKEKKSSNLGQVGRVVGFVSGGSLALVGEVVRHAYHSNATTLEGQLHTAQLTGQLPDGVFVTSQLENGLHMSNVLSTAGEIGVFVGGAVLALSAVATFFAKPKTS